MTASRARVQRAHEIRFTVYGLPTPQGSKRVFVNRHTGKPAVVESAGQRVKDWRADVKEAALMAMGWELGPDKPRVWGRPMLAGPLSMAVAFTLPKPKSAPKTRRTWPDKRPDVDKLLRAVLDALTGVVFADDAQIVYVAAGKHYPGEGEDALDRPGARIYVGGLEES